MRARWAAAAFAAAGLIAVCATPSRAQDEGTLTVGTRVERALVDEALVGVTWSLVTPAAVTLGAAGVRDMGRGTRMRADDRVHVGSVAKTLLAVGVLQLVTEGRLALDAPVGVLLPDVEIDNEWASESPLLLRHLLDHSGGLDDARMWQVFTLRGDPDSQLHASRGSRARVVVRYRPGARFSYSNSGYLVLAMIVERVTGKRYEAHLDSALLAPLGMQRSTFAFTSQGGERPDTSLAMGHFDAGVPQEAFAIPLRPSTQFTTTAEDMATFARFLMGDGVMDGRRIVSAELLRAMAVPATDAASAGLASGYALGLGTRERWGIAGKCHLGNMGTFRAILCLYPEHQRAFFASYNSDPEGGNFDRVDSLIASQLGVPPSAVVPVATPSVDAAQWNGWYVVRPNRFQQFAYLDEVFGVTRIAWEAGKLEMRPLQGAARTLEPVGGALFRLEGRRLPTHVLSVTGDGVRTVAEGLRTFERVSRAGVVARWVSAGAGVLALLYLLAIGGIRTALAWRRSQLGREPLRWVTVLLWLMLLAPLLYFTRPFLSIGDPTPANILVAILSGVLPIALLVTLVGRARDGLRGGRQVADVIALAAAFQWCVALAMYRMLPIMLWR